MNDAEVFTLLTEVAAIRDILAEPETSAALDAAMQELVEHASYGPRYVWNCLADLTSALIEASPGFALPDSSVFAYGEAECLLIAITTVQRIAWECDGLRDARDAAVRMVLRFNQMLARKEAA